MGRVERKKVRPRDAESKTVAQSALNPCGSLGLISSERVASLWGISTKLRHECKRNNEKNSHKLAGHEAEL
jgi:hypothetical protein